MDISIITNSCYQFIISKPDIVSMVKYSHIIPITISLLIGFFVLFKAKFNYYSKVFLLFIITFSLWLLGDLIVWSSTNYNLIYTTWSLLPYLEIIFYVLGLYFAIISIKEKDTTIYFKIFLAVITLPPFILTIFGNSVLGFNQAMCEAENNNFLDTYKLSSEIILLLILLFYMIKGFWYSNKNKIKNFTLIISMFLFLLIFSVTEYFSAITGYYEINLYSLFLLPVLLFIIIYAIFELDIFNFNILGTQYLVVGLVILIVSQLFFVNGNTDKFLTIITVIMSVALSILLFINLKKETDQRVFIENLSNDLENAKHKLEESNFNLENANSKLESLDKLKTEFVSLASHQLRTPLTAIKGYASMLLEGDYGEINPTIKEKIERVMESSNNLILIVEDLLNVSKIEQGGMVYKMTKFDLGVLIKNTIKDLSINITKKGLKLNFDISNEYKYIINGDEEKIRQVLINLIDNSIKYTPKGNINISLISKNNKILFSIKDDGVGIQKEYLDDLFEKFSRGESSKLNTSGSGLGLYLVKEIIKAHNGKVWATSQGLDKGSTFFVELNEEVK